MKKMIREMIEFYNNGIELLDRVSLKGLIAAALAVGGTIKLHEYMTVSRGYSAFGGELLFIPLVYLVRFLYTGVKETLKEVDDPVEILEEELIYYEQKKSA